MCHVWSFLQSLQIWLFSNFLKFVPLTLSCFDLRSDVNHYPGSKVHGANMGPTWVLSAPDGPHVGPMDLVIRVVWIIMGRQGISEHRHSCSTWKDPGSLLMHDTWVELLLTLNDLGVTHFCVTPTERPGASYDLTLTALGKKHEKAARSVRFKSGLNPIHIFQ